MVINTAKVKSGDNAVVFSLGWIDLNVIQGARIVGTNKIIGIDINLTRKELAEKFGITNFVTPKEVENDLVDYLVSLTDGGADYSCECVGNTGLMRQALECCHKGWGKASSLALLVQGRKSAPSHFN